MFKAAIILFATLSFITSAQAQIVARPLQFNPADPYPGAVFVSPQDSAFGAPAIYRSQDPVEQIQPAIAVRQICEDDFAQNNVLKRLVKAQKTSETTGINQVKLIDVSAAASLGIPNVAAVSVNGDYQYNVKFEAADVKVISASDTVAYVVLRNIGKDCRRIIKGHLAIKRVVFIAEKALQAKSLTISFATAKKVGIEAKGNWCWFCPDVKAEAKFEKLAEVSSQKYVTFALVPAEVVPGRQHVTALDTFLSKNARLAEGR